MSSIDHIILFTLIFVLFYLFGKYFYNIKNNINFWLLSIIPISLYSLIVGSRYGWGADYMGYKERLEQAFIYEEEEIGFRWLNQSINLLEFNYIGGFIIYSLIFIICAFILIRSYGKESKYMYAFIIPATLNFCTGIIRQSIAIGFIYMAIYFFNKKKYIALIVSIIIGISIHFSTIVTVSLIYILYLSLKKPITWKISIPTYIFFSFFYDISKTTLISNYIQNFTLQNKFQSYIDNSDHWFGKEAINNIYEQSSFALTMSSLFYISIIYIGFQALKLKPNKNIVYIYNSMTIGIILYRIVFQFEILRRFAAPLEMLHFIIIGYSITIFKNLEVNILNSNIMYKKSLYSYKSMFIYKFGLISIYIYTILYWSRFILINPKAMFFWSI